MVGVRVAGCCSALQGGLEQMWVVRRPGGAGLRHLGAPGPWATLGAIAQLRVKGGSSGKADGEAGDPGERGVRGTTGGPSPGASAESQFSFLWLLGVWPGDTAARGEVLAAV